MAAAQFRTEILAMQSLLAQQRDILQSQQFNQLMTTQTAVFVRKAQALQDLTALYVGDLTAVVGAGPWTSNQRGELVFALSSSLVGARAHCPPNRRSNQMLTTFSRWLTASDNTIMCDDSAGMTCKISKAIERLDHMGAKLISETSKRHVLATICASYSNKSADDWSAIELRDWFVHFKKMYTAKFRNDTTTVSITNFPDSPANLGQGVAALLYTAEDPPVGMTVDAEVSRKLLDKICCRGNAVALRPTQMVQTTPSPQAFTPQMMMSMMGGMFQMMSGRPPSSDVMFQTPSRRNSGRCLEVGDDVPTVHRKPCDKPPTVNGENMQSPSVGGAQLRAIEDTPPTSKARLAPTTNSSPHELAERFLDDLKGGTVDDDDDEDDDDEDADASAAKVHPKGKSKCKAEAKGKTKAKGKAKAKASAKAHGKAHGKASPKAKATCSKAKTFVFKPKVEFESTRNHYLFRPGLPKSETGVGGSTFTVEAYGGKAKAKKAADVYLKEFKAAHKCA